MAAQNITLLKGKIDDVQLRFGKDFQEIEEVEEFYLQCKRSNFDIEEMTFLEQNQMQFFTVNRQKTESKKQAKKQVKVNTGILDESEQVLRKYKLLGNADSMDEESQQSCFAPVLKKDLRLNVFYFNRQMFKLFGSLNEITEFILAKKEQSTKNILVLEDIKDIFVAQRIRDAIQMTQNTQELSTSFYDNNNINNIDMDNDNIYKEQVKQMDYLPPEYQPYKLQEEKSRGAFLGKDADIQDWLCEIGIKYDIDYRFTFSRNESIEFLVSCLKTTVKAKYKKDIGMHDQKGKELSELASAEGLSGFYDQQWVQMLMSINQVSEKKAVGIAREYRSLKVLLSQYQQCSTLKEREAFLSTVQFKGELGKAEKSIGKALSKKVHTVLVSEDPNTLINI